MNDQPCGGSNLFVVMYAVKTQQSAGCLETKNSGTSWVNLYSQGNGTEINPKVVEHQRS